MWVVEWDGQSWSWVVDNEEKQVDPAKVLGLGIPAIECKPMEDLW